jgi:hypothetical protein
MLDFLRANNSGDKVRFITDRTRWEDGAWNDRAGEDIIQYLRSKDAAFKEIPILVYTFSMYSTGFVKDIPFTWTTSVQFIVNKYIDELARGEIRAPWNPVLAIT